MCRSEVKVNEDTNMEPRHTLAPTLAAILTRETLCAVSLVCMSLIRQGLFSWVRPSVSPPPESIVNHRPLQVACPYRNSCTGKTNHGRGTQFPLYLMCLLYLPVKHVLRFTSSHRPSPISLVLRSGGDAALPIAKYESTYYRASYKYGGVQEHLHTR